MTSGDEAGKNSGPDLTEVISAALPRREDLRLTHQGLTHQDGAELAAGYRAMLRDYREHSSQYLESGDYKQAAEKAWGSYAESVKSIAADHGFRLSHHGHIVRVGGRLSSSLADTIPEVETVLREGLQAARSLHQHFYEKDLEPEDVRFSANRVNAAIDLMQQQFSGGSVGR